MPVEMRLSLQQCMLQDNNNVAHFSTTKLIFYESVLHDTLTPLRHKLAYSIIHARLCMFMLITVHLDKMYSD